MRPVLLFESSPRLADSFANETTARREERSDMNVPFREWPACGRLVRKMRFGAQQPTGGAARLLGWRDLHRCRCAQDDLSRGRKSLPHRPKQKTVLLAGCPARGAPD